MKKKIIAIVLGVTMAFTAASCGQNKDGRQNTTSASSAEPAASTSSAASAASDAAESVQTGAEAAESALPDSENSGDDAGDDSISKSTAQTQSDKTDSADHADSSAADGQEDSITRLDAGAVSQADGKDLTVDLNYDEYETLTNATVQYDGKSRSIDLGADGISEYLVKKGTNYFLYLNVKFANDWENLYIVDLASDDLTVTEFDDGVYDAAMTDPEHMTLGTRTDLMSTVQISRSYRVGENGVPEPNESMYSVTPEAEVWLTLKEDAQFNVLDNVDSDATHEEEFAEGTRFKLWRTDNKSIMDCETEDGQYVRFTVDASSYPETINGQYSLDDLFDGTVFAG